MHLLRVSPIKEAGAHAALVGGSRWLDAPLPGTMYLECSTARQEQPRMTWGRHNPRRHALSEAHRLTKLSLVSSGLPCQGETRSFRAFRPWGTRVRTRSLSESSQPERGRGELQASPREEVKRYPERAASLCNFRPDRSSVRPYGGRAKGETGFEPVTPCLGKCSNQLSYSPPPPGPGCPALPCPARAHRKPAGISTQ